MPTYWRYILTHYLRVFALCIIAFVGVLMVMRVQGVAQFVAMGARVEQVLLFCWYQVPYVLPIAVPVAGLVAGMSVVRGMSRDGALTAMRVGGWGLVSVIRPLVVAGAFLALGNFWVVSEMATEGHLRTRLLMQEMTSGNPLLVLQNGQFLATQGAYVQMQGVESGKRARDVVVATHSARDERLQLVVAKELRVEGSSFLGEGVSLISGLGDRSPTQFDTLVVENNAKTWSEAEGLARLIKKSGWKLREDHLGFRLLLARMGEGHWVEGVSEVLRRLSIGLAALSFTLMGAVFGIEVGRAQARRRVVWVVAEAAFALACFFAAKSFHARWLVASLFYLGPHVLVVATAWWTMRRVERGITT